MKPGWGTGPLSAWPSGPNPSLPADGKVISILNQISEGEKNGWFYWWLRMQYKLLDWACATADGLSYPSVSLMSYLNCIYFTTPMYWVLCLSDDTMDLYGVDSQNKHSGMQFYIISIWEREKHDICRVYKKWYQDYKIRAVKKNTGYCRYDYHRLWQNSHYIKGE